MMRTQNATASRLLGHAAGRRRRPWLGSLSAEEAPAPAGIGRSSQREQVPLAPRVPLWHAHMAQLYAGFTVCLGAPRFCLSVW